MNKNNLSSKTHLTRETFSPMNSLCWMRRDLRLHDHAALSHCLKQGETHLAFVFDSHILGKLKNKSDRRVTFIMESLKELESKLRPKNSSLHILHGNPEEEIPKLAQKLKVTTVACNRDYEPYAKERDSKVGKRLERAGIGFKQFKDAVIFEKHEVLTGSRTLYKVFTPYKNKWLELFEQMEQMLPDYDCPLKNLAPADNPKNVLNHDWYKDIGFTETMPDLRPGTTAALKRLKDFSSRMGDYANDRNYPATDGTSCLSPYLRHGNLSIRDMVKAATDKTWLSELIWRDFYQMILDSHPQVVKKAFRPEYDHIKWRGKPEHFKLWCQGETGFPLIDAAMRCFFQTGFMHNRLRMVVASFLCKTLLLDWRLGEEYFAETLLDYDLAANNGGWQWCSSSGADAQPYFRIFNPYSQSEKFDPEGKFIRQWCPELAHLSNKEIHRGEGTPIVSYETNRIRCLEMYSIVKKAH